MSSTYADRVLAIDWGWHKSAYGSAGDVGQWLIDLRSTNWKTVSYASHMLWCSLCHQHAFISPAAEPALPFLLETAKAADDRLLVELLDIFCGFAICSEPGSRLQSGEEWVKSIRARLHDEINWFESLQGIGNAHGAAFVKSILTCLH